MLSSETQTVSRRVRPSSRGELRSHPYSDLQSRASELASRLEIRALRCEFAPERKRLRVLAAAQSQIAACLSGVGVKSNV
jgi:hypothetical protein